MRHPDDLRLRMNADRRCRFGQSGRDLALVCECGDPDCHRTVLLSPQDYDARRPGLILHPEHASFVPERPETRPTAAERRAG